MSTLAIDNIGLLVTNDPELGTVRGAALVFEGERVVAVQRAGAVRTPTSASTPAGAA